MLTQAKDREIRKETGNNSLKIKRAIDGLNNKLK